MNAQCAAARAWLWEADLSEVRDGVGPHAQHIRSCARCRALAGTLVQGYRQLDQGLSALAPEVNVRRFPKRRVVWVSLPLAAAAALALLLGRGDKTPAPPSPLLAQLMFPASPVATPPPGKQAVILEKRDLTVVWLY